MRNTLITIIIFLSSICFGQKYFESRDQIPEKYKWDLTDLCTDSIAWGKKYASIDHFITGFSKSKREIPDAQTLYKIMYQKDSIYNELNKLYLFAMMQEHLNQKDKAAQVLRINMDNLENHYFDAVSWIDPAILEIRPETVKQWLLSNSNLQAYKFNYKSLVREQQHVLNEEKEHLLNFFFNPYSTISGAYNELFYSDLDYPTMETDEGQIIELNSTTYNHILMDENRDLRIKAYKAKADLFSSKQNTCAALLTSYCQMKYAFAQAYNYKSSLQMDVYSDSIPENIYSAMVVTMKENAKPLRKYHQLRAKILKIDDYQSADLYCPIMKGNNNYKYDTAILIIRESLLPLGEEYIKNLDIMLNKRRIDAFESNGRISTIAYTVVAYGISPYILTSFGGKQKDIFDLIHELGHSVHVMLSMQNQPLSVYESTIFKDEITSTINELFLTDFLLKQAKEPQDKLLILESAIDNMSYYYNCALKADFASRLYVAVENEEPVTSDFLNDLYSEIHNSFYGNSIKNINTANWTKYGMIDFYDFKYVTSMTSALIFHDRILSGSKPELNQYLDFLKSGGDDYPLAQLNKAEIDLSNKEVYKVIADYTEMLVSMYEAEVRKQGLLKD